MAEYLKEGVSRDESLAADAEVRRKVVEILEDIDERGDEAECARLRILADRVFPAFANYRRDAAKLNRTIPIVQLARRKPGFSPI